MVVRIFSIIISRAVFTFYSSNSWCHYFALTQKTRSRILRQEQYWLVAFGQTMIVELRRHRSHKARKPISTYT